MSEPFVGEIRMVGFNFAPRGWAFCDGSLLAISQNDALFSLIGTIYGGDGVNTFALPDLRSRLPMHQGQGPGLSSTVIGQRAGVETVTLTTPQIPSHSHAMQATSTAGTSSSPSGGYPAAVPGIAHYQNVAGGVPATTAMNAGAITAAGGSQPHENRQPAQCVTFIMALFGIYPSRT